jgi:hypothetical protein
MGVAISGGAVPFADKDEGASPKWFGDRKTRRVTRLGRIAYANIEALFAECFPSPPFVPGLMPGSTFMYVSSIEVVPFPEAVPSSGDMPTFSEAWCTVTYEPLTDEQDDETSTPGEPLITRTWGIAGEFLTIPANGYKWEVGDLPVDVEEISASKIIPMIEHSITWNKADAIPWTAIKANIGKVNNATLDNRYWDNVAAQTLLYMGAQVSYTFNSNGDQEYTIEHRFQERLVDDAGTVRGWNYFFNPTTQDWDRLLDGAGNPVYTTSALFTDLFQ